MSQSDIEKFISVLETMQSKTSTNEDRKLAETQYTQAKSNPDILVQALIHVIETGNPQLREFACVLIRRCFLEDAALQDTRVFEGCSTEVKKDCCEKLMTAFQNEAEGRVMKNIGNALSTLCDEIISPAAEDGSGSRPESNWPELLQMVLQMSADDSDIEKRLIALDTLKDLVPLYPESLKVKQVDMHKLIELLFTHADTRARVAGVSIVLTMVQSFKAKDWKPLQPSLAVILRVIENLAQQKNSDLLGDVLEELIETCEYEAIFFKPHIGELANLLSQIIAAKDNIEHEPRKTALELFITLAEQKPKMCLQQCESFGAYLLKSAMDCMLEVSDDQEEWALVMDDEEDDDDDELMKLGEEVIDRAVSAFTVNKIGTSFFEAIGTYVNNPDWKYARAGLAAISEGVEYVEKAEHIDELIGLCLKHTTHAHPRVRAQSWHALSRILTDHSDCANRWHQQYMEKTVQGLQDPIDRVQTKNLGAFHFFGEAVDPVIMEKYSKQLLEQLVEKIRTSKHRGVTEECITSIAVVAGAIEKEFAPFYDSIMPMLKTIITESKGEKETRLRGKAFECMSLFGVAVGKEKFKVDVVQCMEAMLTSNQDTALDSKNKEVLQDYLKDAIERIAGVMEEDMGQFLGPLVQIYLKTLDINNATNAACDDDEETLIPLHTGVKVKSAYFKEMADAADTIAVLVRHSKEAFLPHIETVCGVLMKLFAIEDKSVRETMGADEVLNKCSDVWAAIIAILAQRDPNLCQKLIAEFSRMNVKWLEQESEDVEIVSSAANSIAGVLLAACPPSGASEEKRKLYADPTQYLDQPTIMELWKICKTKFQENMTRRLNQVLKDRDWRDGAENDDVEGERHGLDESDENHEASVAVGQIAGALMLLNPELFAAQILPEVNQLIVSLLDVSQIDSKVSARDREVIISKNKILAYFLACDVCEHLREKGVHVWASFLEKLFADLKNVDFEVRHAACYFVYQAASVSDAFAPHSQTALAALLDVLQNPSHYGKGAQRKYVACDDIKIAEDNVVAAVFQLLACNPQLSMQHGDAVWAPVLDKLPLKVDTDVGAQVVLKLLDCVVAERKDVIGENNERIAKICGIFTESYKSCDNEEVDKRLRTLFTKFDEAFFVSTLKPQFKDTQWRKLEKLMSDPATEPAQVVVN